VDDHKADQPQAAAAHSDSLYRLLVAGITDYAIYMIDPDGRVVNWNAGAERFNGYAAHEIIGQHFSCFYTDEERTAGGPAKALDEARLEGRYEREGWRLRKNGQRFWASVVIDPIQDDNGKLIGFAKVTRDLTEREEVQRELERVRETLLQAQKMDAIGQLTGGVAHDFNNLLMAILSSLELLRKRLPDDKSSMRLLDNAMEGARRGAILTQRLLAFARRQDLHLSWVDIPRLVRGMTDLIERSLGPSIQIETRFPLRLEGVTADVNQLEMAVLNLVVNARDAMPGGGSITIGAREQIVGEPNANLLHQGAYVVLSVTDEGTGMDAETLARAAEPFFTTKGVGKGTGLGLSMVHGVAEQFGGRLVLQSEMGKGTVAELWLPVGQPPQTEDAHVLLEHHTRASPQKLTVLAVDDDDLVLMNTVALLEDLGHKVFEAHSGERALEIFRREPSIDIIVTDQAMPKMTGIQFALAARAQRDDVPVILATGYGELPSDETLAWVKLSKPFGLADLSRALAVAHPPDGLTQSRVGAALIASITSDENGSNLDT
jgi:PAS domain S-box-containing protein